MTYAIISLGGKQYRVQEGERLLVDRLPTEEGKTFHPEVLMLGGDGAFELAPKTQVTARVIGSPLGEKIRIGKYRPKSGYRRHTGFRAKLSQIEIESIGGGARKAAPKAGPPPAPRLPPKAPADRDRVDGGGRKEAPPRQEARGGRRGGAREAAARLRRHDRRGHQREVRPLDDRAGRGCARVRARAREAQGRARGARSEEGTPGWLIRRDSARRGTAATRTRRCSASRSSTARRSRPGRSSCASAARGSVRGTAPASVATTRSSPSATARWPSRPPVHVVSSP